MMTAKQDYLKGQYEAAADSKTSVNSVCYKIGGLVFTGQHQEARLIYDSLGPKLDSESLAVADFHMGLSYTRTSDYQQAGSHFAKNLQRARSGQLSPMGRFFAFQGVAFFRFFFSRHRKSQWFAEKGYQALLEMEEAPGLLLALSLDLQAHNKIQMGWVNQGLKLLEEALRITKKNKLSDLHSTIEISHILYQTEFGVDLATHISNLTTYLKKSKNKDDYSNSEIVLQIAKLKMLQGQFQGASDFLNHHFDVIYKNQNKRKVAILNTLMAQLVLYRGQHLEALSIINVALTHLDPQIDKSLYLPLLGLKIRVLKRMGRDCQNEIAESEKIVNQVDRQVNKSIQGRLHPHIETRPIGEDRVGDLFDKVHRKDKGALQEILQYGFLSLLFPLYDLDPSKQHILICQGGERILLVGEGQVVDTGRGLTKLQVQLLARIQQGAVTKEDLIEKVWGYQYDPLRHDPLVYTAIGRLRKTLEPFSRWIFADENHYSLQPNVEVRLPEAELLSKVVEDKEKQKIEMPQLNYRQLRMLSLGQEEPVSVSQYAETWDVTRMTALRDLTEMMEKGLVGKIGRGKATRYYLMAQSELSN